MLSKSSKFKSLVSGSLVIIPLLLSAAAQAENCPSTMQFQANKDGQTGRYYVPGTGWSSAAVYPAVNNPSFIFSKVYFVKWEDGRNEVLNCQYNILDPQPKPVSDTAKPKVVMLNAPPNNNSSMVGSGWQQDIDARDLIIFVCQGSTKETVSTVTNCKFTLGIESHKGSSAPNPFGKN